MANTLTQLSYLSNDVLKQGIADTIVRESPLMRYLPFKTISGNSLKYNMETALSGGSWVTVNDTITEAAPTWAQRTQALYELIGDCDVDMFAQQTLSNEQNLKAAIIEKKAKGMAYEFEEKAILGGTTAVAAYNSSKVMKGLMKLVAECESTSTADWDGVNNAQCIPASATSACIALADMEKLIDAVRPGRPDALLLSRRTRRKLVSLAQAAGNNLQVGTGALGEPIERWGGSQGPMVIINDNIPDNLQDGAASVLDLTAYTPSTTRAAGNDNSAIFAVKFGEDGFCGLQNGGIQVTPVGVVQDKNAERTRLSFYCALAAFSTLSVAALFNFTDS
jgi:HK97 family phage major capsid protein